MNPMPPEPTPEQWAAYHTYMAEGRSARRAADILGRPREVLITQMMAASDWLRDSGWTEKYNEAIRIGFCDSDARMHADQTAAYNTRMAQEESAC